jgi:sulfite reductase (NADPH) flavoprotein alpha-component
MGGNVRGKNVLDRIPPPLPGAEVDGAQRELLRTLGRSLSAEQALWVSGYFAGIAEARGGFTAAAASAVAAPGEIALEPGAGSPKITVLYGSETGNAEGLARDIARRAQERGLIASVDDLARYKTRELKNEQTLLFVTSTHGEGEPPEPALPFFEFLGSRKAPSLKHAQFAVLALGDSTYAQYCEAGRVLDRRLEELGAARLHDRIDCDVDYDIEAKRWIDAVLDKLQQAGPAAAAATGAVRVSAASAPATVLAYSKSNPFLAQISASLRLTGRGSSKDTRHIEISLEGSDLQYTPGDALGVVPQNDPALVAELIALGGWSGEETVAGRDGEVTLQQALQSDYEITALTPRFIEKWAEWAAAAQLTQLDADARARFMAQTHIFDLVKSHPVRGLAAQDFVQALRGLQPRLYSIASSLELTPEEVHLCVAPVRYELHGRARNGVASTHLADRLEAGASIPVYVQRNEHFRLPADPDTPIVMIGAGTGVAPYRAFMQQREALGVNGRSWLFFGERNFRTDFLYQTEWQAWLRDGVLTHADVAFSRDQEEKLYVQHRLQQQGAELYRWIDDGAHLYVCGDAEHMAADVHEALLAVMAQHGGLSADRAREALLEMQAAGRYQKDVY